MSPILAGGLIGLGQAGQQLSKEWSAERIEQAREEANSARQAAHLEAQKYMHAESTALTREQGGLTRELSRELAGQTDTRIRDEGRETRGLTQTLATQSNTLSRDLATQADTRVREEGAAGRALQTELAKIHEASATRRHGQSMGLQKAQLEAALEQVSLLPQGDGTMMKVKKDGTVLGPAMFDGKPLLGPKDVSASAKVLIDGNSQIIRGLMETHSKSFDDKEKQSIMAQVVGLKEENGRLAGMKSSGSGVDWSTFGFGTSSTPASPAPAREGLIGEPPGSRTGHQKRLDAIEQRKQEREQKQAMEEDRQAALAARKREYGDAGY